MQLRHRQAVVPPDSVGDTGGAAVPGVERVAPAHGPDGVATHVYQVGDDMVFHFCQRLMIVLWKRRRR
ncbi:hypothetical protein HPB52_019725 [Rhipicephalus sanguineus]|uniref:Uncharacterized protein n=1 Tax=Rhipicephalus sanguineus TaxID=34632 RepID=A0A9D4T7V8_RHISA|nr:hypothetical protein HPB52_019725 [Rhipicephalus sanguineus]